MGVEGGGGGFCHPRKPKGSHRIITFCKNGKKIEVLVLKTKGLFLARLYDSTGS